MRVGSCSDSPMMNGSGESLRSMARCSITYRAVAKNRCRMLALLLAAKGYHFCF